MQKNPKRNQVPMHQHRLREARRMLSVPLLPPGGQEPAALLLPCRTGQATQPVVRSICQGMGPDRTLSRFHCYCANSSAIDFILGFESQTILYVSSGLAAMCSSFFSCPSCSQV